MSDAQPQAVSATIQDAVRDLFDAKAPPVEASPIIAPTMQEPASEPVESLAVEPVAATTSVSASDHALEVARARKKVAAMQGKLAALQATTAPTKTAPTADEIKLALAIRSAGSDPIKRLEAAGLDLRNVIQAYEKQAVEDPDFDDPVSKKVNAIAEKLAQYERREREADDSAAQRDFRKFVETRANESGDTFEYIAAHGVEAQLLVEAIVIEAADRAARGEGVPMNAAEAMKLVEADYEARHTIAAKTKKMARLFPNQQQTPKKPGVGQSAPAAGAAPVIQTKPRSVQDVINSELDALFG